MTWPELRGFLKRPIAFHRVFAEVSGGALPGLMLSQAFYWTEVMEDKAEEKGTTFDGWFYKTREEWTKETAMTRWEQERAREALRKSGLWEESRRGMPCTIHYRIRREALLEVIAAQFPSVGAQASNQLVAIAPTTRRASRKPVGAPSATTIETETTSKTKQTTTASVAAVDDANASQNSVWSAMLIGVGLAPAIAAKHVGPDVPRVLAWWQEAKKHANNPLGLLRSALAKPDEYLPTPAPKASETPRLTPEQAKEKAARREEIARAAFEQLPTSDQAYIAQQAELSGAAIEATMWKLRDYECCKMEKKIPVLT